MRGLSIFPFASLGIFVALLAAPVAADDLDQGSSWQKINSKGRSFVFGRFEGRFEGPDFKGRKIEVQSVHTGKEYYISVGEGLGYFEETLPPGSYTILGLEATYYPPIRPFPQKFRPVKQRLGLRPTGGKKLPAFYVYAKSPVYIGTIQVDNSRDGIVYRGHFIRVLDEYAETVERLGKQYPKLASSLVAADIQPTSHLILKPTRQESPLELVEVEDPISRARDYIAEGKYQQAVNWLRTFMPASDRERAQARLLIGEAFLGDREYGEAINRLGEVLEADPENLRALRLLARAHSYNEDLEDALNLYEALAEAMPGDTEAHLQLGYLFALRSDLSRSDLEFSSAFEQDMDYLLHDIGPFAVVLKAVGNKSAEYEPPKVIRDMIRPPRSIQSRRNSRGGLALLIDHRGKVVAARINPGGSNTMPIMMLSVIRATFKPAALNGVPIPSLLVMGGGGWGSGGTQ
jgi:tetratricopeptide (TPR) repeat protein